MQSKEQALFDSLRNSSPEVKVYQGLGYCAYCSKELHDVFKANHINSKILLGEYFSDSKLAQKCIAANIKLIKSFQEDTGIYSDIKSALLKRNGKLPERIGHVVVLVEETVYDMTSGQFGLASTYTLDQFKDIWRTVFVCSVKVNEKDTDNFKLEKVHKRSILL